MGTHKQVITHFLLHMAGAYGAAPPVLSPCRVCGLTLINEQGFACITCDKQCHGRCGYLMRECPWCFRAARAQRPGWGKRSVQVIGVILALWMLTRILLVFKKALQGLENKLV